MGKREIEGAKVDGLLSPDFPFMSETLSRMKGIGVTEEAPGPKLTSDDVNTQ